MSTGTDEARPLNRMARISLVIVAVVGIGGVAVFGYSMRAQSDHPVRDSSVVDESTPRGNTATRPPDAQPLQSAVADAQPAPGIPQRAASEQKTITPEMIAQWISDSTSQDATVRADAIVALADAPKSQAIPVLKNVLSTGKPQVDRQLALSSLHALAVEQGDTDGKIRNVLREVIYHGDDDDVGHGAQTVLEDIERKSCGGTGQNACNPAN